MLQEAEQEFVAKVEAALQANQVDEDQLIEERRKRRQQILAKHQQEQAPLQGMPMSVQPNCCCFCFMMRDWFLSSITQSTHKRQESALHTPHHEFATLKINVITVHLYGSLPGCI